MLVALASALAVAFGVGMIWSGFDADVPLATRAEAEAVLPAPIAAAIPATGPVSAKASGGRWRRLGGLAQILFGVLVIGICFGVLVVVF